MRIGLMAIGDPTKAGTWSGVPFRILCQLERKCHDVIPLDLASDFLWHWCGVFFNRILRRIVPMWNRVAFCNTRMGLLLSSRWLKKMSRQLGPFDILFSTSFSVDFRDLSCPCILLHDWTEGYAILRTGGQLNCAEEVSERNQLDLIKRACLVVALYPKACEYLINNIGKGFASKIRFICNPVNASPLTPEEVELRLASRSKRILVVGGAWYQENVEYVIQAADALHDAEIVVDVVGRESAKTVPRFCNVNFYGYLDKDKPDEMAKYKLLFLGARCLVNIRKGWGAGSSIAEAMFGYVPVIVGRYSDIEAMYGEAEGRFGFYCQEGNVAELSRILRRVIDLDDDQYRNLCVSAHNVCRNDTYEFLIGTILADLEKRHDDRLEIL